MRSATARVGERGLTTASTATNLGEEPYASTEARGASVCGLRRTALGTLAISAGIALVVSAVALAIFRRVEPAAVFASLVIVAFYSFDLVQRPIVAIAGPAMTRLEGIGVPVPTLPMVIVIGLAALVLWLLLRGKIPGPETVRVVAVLGGMLVAVASFQAVGAYSAAARTATLAPNDSRALGSIAAAAESRPSTGYPDIYFIVLDRYTSGSALKEVSGYDNAAFVSALRKRGFHVADSAFSNYSITYTSLGSTLNMRYLDNYLNLAGYEKMTKDLQVNRAPLYRLVGNSLVARHLKRRGYTYIHVSSGWAATASSPIADRLVNTATSDEYVSAILGTTALKQLSEKQKTLNQRTRVVGAFGALSSVRKNEHPSFMFAHILCPHFPYVFRANGSDPKYDQEWVRKDVRRELRAYIEQVKYVNKLTLQQVDAIKKKSGSRPYVIIVQGDHGAVFRVPGTSSRDVQRRKNAILYAVYFSDGNPKGLDRVETPVNTFRIVFDKYFGTSYGRLPDRAFYSATEKWPYWPAEITRLYPARRAADASSSRN